MVGFCNFTEFFFLLACIFFWFYEIIITYIWGWPEDSEVGSSKVTTSEVTAVVVGVAAAIEEKIKYLILRI